MPTLKPSGYVITPHKWGFLVHVSRPKALFMGRRYVAPPFTACPCPRLREDKLRQWGGAGIDFPNRPFLSTIQTLFSFSNTGFRQAGATFNSSRIVMLRLLLAEASRV